MNNSLFEIALDYKQSIERLYDIDLDELTIRDTIESIGGDLESKVNNIACAIKNMEALSDQIAKAMQAMGARASALEKRADGIKTYLLKNMQLAGVEKIEGPYLKISVKKNPPKVNVFDEKMVPLEYFSDPPPPPPPPPRIDKSLVKKAIQEGFDVPGCMVEQGFRLEIK